MSNEWRKERIQNSIKSGPHLMFQPKSLVDPTAYKQALTTAADYAVSTATPYLGNETTRYQTILLSSSLALLTISVFGITLKTPYSSQDLKLEKLITPYSVFLAMVGLIFALQAYSDHRRAQFAYNKIHQGLSDLTEIAKSSASNAAKMVLQLHFWTALADDIDRSYEHYYSILNATYEGPGKEVAPSSGPFDPAPLSEENVTGVDIAEVERLISWLKTTEEMLDRDMKRFGEGVNLAFDRWEERQADLRSAGDGNAQEHNPSRVEQLKSQIAVTEKRIALQDSKGALLAEIEDTYERHLEPWLVARNELIDLQQIHHGTPEANSLGELTRTVKGALSIRRMYVRIEVFGPLLFAIFSIYRAYANLR